MPSWFRGLEHKDGEEKHGSDEDEAGNLTISDHDARPCEMLSACVAETTPQMSRSGGDNMATAG
jgi:hypothetical protein